MVVQVINGRTETEDEGCKLQDLGCTMDSCTFNTIIGSQLKAVVGSAYIQKNLQTVQLLWAVDCSHCDLDHYRVQAED